MLSKILLAFSCCWGTTLVLAGFPSTRLAYNAGHNAPLLPFAYKANFGTAYAVAPHVPSSLRAAVPYNTFAYANPSVFKLRGRNSVAVAAVDCTPTWHSGPKFAFPAPVPAVYDAPLPVDDDSADVIYNGFEVPNIVIKFGPPITTTTTTYSATAAAAAAGVHVRTAFKAANGW